jgi:arylsulfatase A-like enzyme
MGASSYPRRRATRSLEETRALLHHGTVRRRCSCTAAVLLAGLAAGTAAPAQAEDRRPNILLLLAEDLGPRIGAFGDPVAVTPRLDRLAEEGTRYTRVFTTAGVCGPSRAALLTGVHAISTGSHHMRASDKGYRSVPPPEVKAFPELLRAAGYATFTDFKLDYQFSGTLSGSGPFTIWDEEGFTAHWRKLASDRPFFGLINFVETHESGVFPRPAWPRSGVHATMQLIHLFLHIGHDDVVSAEDVALPPYYPDTPLVRADVARHYNNAHRMDERVGEILDQLEADGLLDSTVVIWTSDHGDGLPRAKRELFDSGIHVPMIIRWPPSLRPQDAELGAEDARLVSFVDLAPTILALAGVRAPAWMEGRVFAGAQSAPKRRHVFAARDRIDELADRQRAVRDERYKYIRCYLPGTPGAAHTPWRDVQDTMRELWAYHERGELDGAAALWFEPRPEESLYDTWRDPHEVRDLAADPDYEPILERLRGALDAWLAQRVDWGAVPEDEMIARMWPGGDQPVTGEPIVEIRGGEAAPRVRVSETTPGSSLGVRLGGGAWNLYTGPFPAPLGTRIEAKAVRYGWAESRTVRAVAEVPDPSR